MIDTFAIGTFRIGNFIITISHNLFIDFSKSVEISGYKSSYKYHDFSKQFNLYYYNVSLVELDKFNNQYYINLVEKLKTHNPYFDFARPTKIQDEKEIQSWSSNKFLNIQMPMWTLKKKTVVMLTDLLYRLSEEGITLLGM